MDIRVHACAATTALAAVCAGPAMAASLFAATLSGGQEVPSSGSPHTGTATFELLGAGTATPSLAFDMLFDPAFDFGLDGNVGPQQVVGLHIHRAPRDQNGSVVYGIISPSSEVLGFSDVVFSATADGATRITGEWDADEGTGGLTFSDFAAIFDEHGARNGHAVLRQPPHHRFPRRRDPGSDRGGPLSGPAAGDTADAGGRRPAPRAATARRVTGPDPARTVFPCRPRDGGRRGPLPAFRSETLRHRSRARQPEHPRNTGPAGDLRNFQVLAKAAFETCNNLKNPPRRT